MYERLLNKMDTPSPEYIKSYIGINSSSILDQFEDFLNTNYQLTKELKFPFGNNYGWGYKYSHKSSHICYAFFEAGAFTVTIQIGDKSVSEVEEILPSLSAKAQQLWNNRYPCGTQGGWIHYRIVDTNDLNDIIEFVKVKKKPVSI
ncbi:DUF3788 domain-containing protein [Anaerocolumna sp. MB42-C2]|uniref:DUF3788 domain-containing protein n=1 Tax=Anaerocolumna sp. MB42-C2 TaxID=3070997 RepID=UPI0027E0CBC9|nr:DUF3788 domain-containing protein [Anaerocolumna sp. MB42-C2]WMJ87170.1 DUF3788 domain-containing protein [Anaerocolumna sp. MB42-C2]